MNDDILAELERLASPEAARRVEQARNRSSFRPPFTACTCDIESVEGPYDETFRNGTVVKRVAIVAGNLRDLTYADNASGMEGGQYDIPIGLPQEANAHSEYFLTVDSLRAFKPDAKTIFDFNGLKDVRLVEDVHEFTGRTFHEDPKGSQTDRNGKRGYWGDGVLETRYYKVAGVGSLATTPAPTHSIADFPELTAAALAYLDGKTAADFTKGFMAYAGAEGIGSPADRLAFSSFVIRGAGEGGFIATMIAEDRVTVGADGYEVREAATA